jgi:hypothetical protein
MTIEMLADALNCTDSMSERCNAGVQRRFVQPRIVSRDHRLAAHPRTDYLPAAPAPVTNTWEAMFVFPYPAAGTSRRRG